MSYTNKTTHYELPQYVATDKPKYLTDFNETMATIDGQMYNNATAAATAQTAAEGAQSTADGAVSSIGTLNTQINGDPTDPSDTGLAGAVSGLDGDVNTIQSLLGDGTPTTSNQTVIGAINAIEASIAPSEDSATLGANYATGAQFARGGVVYEALTDLTSGTAFTSLTLNTDYKVSDTLVEQIAEVASSIPDASDKWVLKAHNQSVAATHDGTKTYLQLIGDLVTAFNALTANLATGEFIRPIRVAVGDKGMALFYFRDFPKNDVCNVQAFNAIVNNTPNSADFWTIYISSAPKFVSGTFGGSASDTWVDEGAVVATDDITIFYDVYHKA